MCCSEILAGNLPSTATCTAPSSREQGVLGGWGGLVWISLACKKNAACLCTLPQEVHWMHRWQDGVQLRDVPLEGESDHGG